MNTSRNVLVYCIPVLMFALITLLSPNYYQATLAQLEIPEAKPLGTTVVASPSNTTGFLVFEDLGYKIEYPDDWEAVAPGVQYGLSAFQAPDGSSITVKFISSDDFTVDGIEELFDLYQDTNTQNILTRNSTTTLGGLPGFIEEGIFTFTPNIFESAAGEQGYTNRIYNVVGYSENKDGFYNVLFSADSKAQYDETLPVAKEIIESFTVEEGVQNTQSGIEESQDEEADDTFVGSAGNNDEDNEEQEND